MVITRAFTKALRDLGHNVTNFLSTGNLTDTTQIPPNETPDPPQNQVTNPPKNQAPNPPPTQVLNSNQNQNINHNFPPIPVEQNIQDFEHFFFYFEQTVSN